LGGTSILPKVDFFVFYRFQNIEEAAPKVYGFWDTLFISGTSHHVQAELSAIPLLLC